MPLAPTRTIPITRKALSFDGVDDYAWVSDAPSLNPTNITVIAYFRPYTLTGEHTIVGKFDWVEGKGTFALKQAYDTVKFWLIYGTDIAGVSAPDALSIGEWCYAAGVYDGSYIKLFINQTLTSQTSETRPLLPSDADLNIGRRGDGANVEFFNGEIAYVLMYNRALSDDEIAQIYNDPDHPPKSGLVLWLHDTSIDAENNIWRDLSGKGNNATIYGATEVDVVRPAVRTQSPIRTLSPVR